jgi:hypothetical protein
MSAVGPLQGVHCLALAVSDAAPTASVGVI